MQNNQLKQRENENFKEMNLEPLSKHELETTEGGAAPLVGAAAIAAG